MRLFFRCCMTVGIAALLAGCGGDYIAPPPATDAGWTHYGADAGGSRYSTAAQITPANVSHLQVAWTFFRTGALPKHDVSHVDGIDGATAVLVVPDLHPADVKGGRA